MEGETFNAREKISEKIMQQKPAWKAPPCVASLCTHINCGNQLLSLVDSAHGTEAHMHSEYIYFPLRHLQGSHNHSESM